MITKIICILSILTYHHYISVSATSTRRYRSSSSLENDVLDNTILLHLPTSNCTYHKDPDFIGILVDCRNLGLYQIKSEWMPASTTTAFFDQNNIGLLSSEAFSGTPNMSHLSLSQNRLTATSGLPSFSQCKRLQILNLEGNAIRLDTTNWVEPYFENLTNLLELNIGLNGNEQGIYPEYLLQGLNNLQIVTLDTFSGTLEFGSIFNNTPNLSTLILRGGYVAKIANSSFTALEKVPVKALILYKLQRLMDIEPGAFSNLKSLHTYKVNSVPLAMNTLLHSLYPFQGKTFRSIEFICTERYNKNLFMNNSMVSKDSFHMLTNICVENVTLCRNSVFYFSIETIGNVWPHCLKKLVLRVNPLMPDGVNLAHFLYLRAIKVLEISGTRYSLFNPRPVTWQCAFEDNVLGLKGQRDFHFRSNHDIGSMVTEHSLSDNKSLKNMKAGNNMLITKRANVNHRALRQAYANVNHRALRQAYANESEHSAESHVSSLYFIPRSLTAIKLNGQSHSLVNFDKDIQVINGYNLIEINVADNGIRFHFHSGHLLGLDNLEVLDLSQNLGRFIAPDFFDHFPQLRVLNISDFDLDPFLLTSTSRRRFQSLTRLQILDISKNSLRGLSPKTFDTLSNLISLNLAWNKFEDLPLSLVFLPNLNMLDLRENSIQALSDSSRQSLDEHSGGNGARFTLKLAGNVLSCRCTEMRFLAWLQRTNVKLDNNGNYTCMDEEGHIGFTSSVENIEALWRKCHGWNSLMISLVIVCLTMLSFSVFFLVIKFKTRFLAYLIALARLRHGPGNYPTGVFIGYANSDATYVRFLLAPFIEDDLGLTTYIRHRDLEPGIGVADSIVQAIESSWRVLIVISNDFLNVDPWAWFSMQTAIFSVHNLNPDKVAILVDERLVYRIPHCLLTVVHEENIITVENKARMSYEEKMTLRHAILV